MLRANDEFFRVIHIAREDYLPFMLDVWRRFVTGEQRAYKEMLDKASRGDAVAECDLCSLSLAGKAGYWTRNRARLLARNGDSEIFYVSVENITAEKAAQAELARQKDMLYKLYNGVPCGIIDYLEMDGGLQMVNFNDTAWRLNGYEGRADFEGAYRGTQGRLTVHPDDLPGLLEKARSALSLAGPVTAECRVERKDRTFYWAEIRLQCYARDDAVMLQSVFMNIDDRREQETQKYGRILYSIFDEVLLWNYQEDTCQIIKSYLPHARAGSVRERLIKTNEAWIAKYVHPEDRDAVLRFVRRSNLQSACAGDVIPYVDYRVLLPGGETAMTRASAYSVDNDRFMICCRNVTKEKQAAEQAKQIAVLRAKLEEQERYRIIVEQTGAAVIEWNHKTGEFFHSGTYGSYEMSRCDSEELFHNQARLTTVYEPDVPLLKRFFAESKSGKPSAEAVLRLRMTDGSFRWTRMRGDFLFDAEGEPVRTIGTLTDIDNEMRAKETLRQTNTRLENIIANIPAGVGIYSIGRDRTAVPLYVSDRACRMFGFTREEYDERIARGAPVNFMPELSALSASGKQEVKNGESITVPRIHARRKDGSRFWLRITCSFVTDEKGATVCYATLSDISHLVEAEQAADSVRELYELLIESTETITLDYYVFEDLLRVSFMGGDGARTEAKLPDFMACLQNGESRVVPSSRSELLRAMRSAVSGEAHGEMDVQARGPDREEHWYHVKYLSLSKEGVVYRVVGRADNFDGIVHSQEARLEQARIDLVTGLRGKDSARAAVEERLRRRPDGQLDAVLFLDIDNFKRVNDTEGHLQGDRILARAAAILKNSFRSTDIVARFGGDEFLVYMVAPESRQAVLEKAQQVLDAIREVRIDEANTLGCSIGIAEVTGDMRDFDRVFYCADHAMYLAKQSGKNRFCVE